MSKRAEDEKEIDGAQPNSRMLYIGADFYMHDCEQPKFRGQDKSLARFEEVMKEWSAYSPGMLVPLLLLQRLIGMCLFHGRFQWRVRRYLNSGIRCLRERTGDHRVMSRAWQRDVEVIFQRAMAREPFPMGRPKAAASEPPGRPMRVTCPSTKMGSKMIAPPEANVVSTRGGPSMWWRLTRHGGGSSVEGEPWLARTATSP